MWSSKISKVCLFGHPIGQTTFLIDWHYKHLRNTIDRLFYREHFHGFSECDLWKHWEKKIHNKHMYICGSQKFWSFMKFYFVHIVKVCFVLKNSHHIYTPLYMHKIIPNQEMRKNYSKSDFTKICQMSWFSCGWLQISKCSISLAQLSNCSKSKVTPLGSV